MSYTLSQLVEWEQKAMQLRRDYKYFVQQQQEIIGNKIIFPAIHVQETDDVLRYGMPWLYNGFMIATPGHGLLVDPWVDFSYRWLKSWYPISWCDSMFITHQHIDHVGWAAVFLERLLRARKMINIILTPETIADMCIPQYYLWASPERASHRLTLLDQEKQIQCGPYTIQTISHFHGIACYGFSTMVNGKKITHISDTGYATLVRDDEWSKVPWKDMIVWKPIIIEKYETLRQALHGSDVAVINLDALNYRSVSTTHASARDIIDMVKDNNIDAVIIAHINPVWNYEPGRIQQFQEFIQDETWVKTVIPWKDWLEFEF